MILNDNTFFGSRRLHRFLTWNRSVSRCVRAARGTRSRLRSSMKPNSSVSRQLRAESASIISADVVCNRWNKNGPEWASFHRCNAASRETENSYRFSHGLSESHLREHIYWHKRGSSRGIYQVKDMRNLGWWRDRARHSESAASDGRIRSWPWRAQGISLRHWYWSLYNEVVLLVSLISLSG